MNRDERLSTDAQLQAAQWVRDLPSDDVPSMVWRADLNERIRTEAARKVARRRRFQLWSPAIGLTITAALALVMIAPTQRALSPTPIEKPEVEASLIALFDRDQRAVEAVGVGVRPNEVPAEPAIMPDSFDDYDVGVL